MKEQALPANKKAGSSARFFVVVQFSTLTRGLRQALGSLCLRNWLHLALAQEWNDQYRQHHKQGIKVKHRRVIKAFGDDALPVIACTDGKVAHGHKGGELGSGDSGVGHTHENRGAYAKSHTVKQAMGNDQPVKKVQRYRGQANFCDLQAQDQRWYGGLEILLSMMWFFGAIFYARFHGQQSRH